MWPQASGHGHAATSRGHQHGATSTGPRARNCAAQTGLAQTQHKNPQQRPGKGRSPAAKDIAMKRTYQASKVRRARTHGFLVRMKTRGGRAVINARRAKGRKRLAV